MLNLGHLIFLACSSRFPSYAFKAYYFPRRSWNLVGTIYFSQSTRINQNKYCIKYRFALSGTLASIPYQRDHPRIAVQVLFQKPKLKSVDEVDSMQRKCILIEQLKKSKLPTASFRCQIISLISVRITNAIPEAYHLKETMQLYTG